MELQFIPNQIKKRRIGVLVEEGLYDFTEEELKRMYQCRGEDENDGHFFTTTTRRGKSKEPIYYGGVGQNYQYGGQDTGLGELAESENSDTESALQDRLWGQFNNGFLEEDHEIDHEHESVGMVSSLSHSDFSEMESSDYDSDNVKYAIQVVTNSSVTKRGTSSENKNEDLSQIQPQKKRIVPEAWLSDTNYYVESDESFEEDQKYPKRDTQQNQSIRNKISSFGNRWLPNLLKYAVK